jgi:LysM repeat protein
MKYFLVIFFWLAFACGPLQAQEYKKHTVAKGETVTNIAQKYKVTPYDIYRLNPDAKSGIQEGAVLLIPALAAKPAPVKEQPTKVTNPIHEVQPKETLYGIAKKYNVSEADLTKANAEVLKNGLQPGQQLVIPVKGSGVAAQAKASEKLSNTKNEPSYFYHTVEAGETKYGISRQYGMSLQLLETLNPEIKDTDTLKVGYKLKLDKNSVIEEAEVSSKPAPGAKTEYKEYTVQPKETFFSIGQDTGLTQAEIIALNPEAKDGLKEGMVLKLPAGQSIAATPGSNTPGSKNLVNTLKKDDAKKLALLIPFNLARFENDTVRNKMLRQDKFLNMTLDFYAGALIAIDSANALGLPLEVRILDANETSKSSDLAALKSRIAGVNAIIGPFYQNNVETAASLFPGIPVISPLSKDTRNGSANLYQSIPSADAQRKALLDYITAGGANVMAIIDAKKTSSRDYIKSNYPKVKLLEGGITSDKIRQLLVSGKKNYVLLDTETLTAITGTTRLLVEAQSQFDIQLAVAELTDKYEHNEVPLERLIKLKTLYPSATNDSQDERYIQFKRAFREKNGYTPTSYAIRGFDVTFDVITRLFQKEDFSTLQQNVVTEQVNNKFNYINGNQNTGVFIMQYDEANTLKKVN